MTDQLPPIIDEYKSMEALARDVMRYWHSLGFDAVYASATQENARIGKGGYGPHFRITSNLRNGCPPNASGRDVYRAIGRSLLRREVPFHG